MYECCSGFDAQTVMNQVFTIIAENAFGSSSAEWHLLVGETPLPGLEGRYYRLDKDENACQIVFSDYLMDLYAIRNDVDINHPFEHRNGYWEGIPSPMFYYASHVEWNGYLNVEEEGEWQFHSQHIDGYRLSIDGNYVVNSYSCTESIFELTKKVSLTKGYHKVQVLWFSSHTDFMLVITVKRPSDPDFIAIPEGLFVHTPSSVLSMSTQTNQFYIGRPISPISPLSFAVQEPLTSFSISPDLPSGLTFSNGQISGTPSTQFGPTVFEIAATSSGKQYKTKVTFASYTVDAPEWINVTDGINNITSVRWEIYKTIEKLKIQCSSEFCKISIAPELPQGIKFNSKTLEISGRPTQAMVPTAYTISASTEESSITKELPINIPICRYGHYYHMKGLMYSGTVDFYILKGKELVESHEGIKLADYCLVLCIEPYNYDIAIRPNPFKQSVSSLTLTRDDDIVFIDTSIHENSWYNTTWEMIQTEPPKLNIEITEYYVTPSETLSIPFEVVGFSRPITVSPALPKGGKIETLTNSIEIPIEKTGRSEYTFKVENDAGYNEVKVMIWSDECPDRMVLIKCHGKEYYTTDSLTLIRASDGKKVISRLLDVSTPQPFNMCIERVAYYLTRSRKSTSNNVNHVVLTNQEGQFLGSMEFSNQKNQTELFELASLAQENSTRLAWVSSRSVNRKWKEIGLNENSWVTNSRDLGSFSSQVTTAYFRYHLHIKEGIAFPMLIMDVKANGGFVMYLNGVEVIRMNLPSGELSSDQMALPYVDLSQWKRISVNTEWLQKGDNVLSVELHCYSTGQPELERILFEINHEQITGSSYFLSYSGIATGTNRGSSSSSGPESVFFETNNYRYWEDVKLPAQIRLTFPNEEPRLVNRMVMRSTFDGQNQPIRFEVLGVINETVYDGNEFVFTEVKESVLVVNNPYILDSEFKDETFYFYPSRPYSAYEISVHATNSGNQTVRINKVWFFYDHYSFCPEEKDWPRTRGGDLAYGKCSIWTIGQSTRVCDPSGAWLDLDKGTCLTRWAGKVNAFLDTAYRIDNCTLEIFYNNTEAAFRSVIVREMTVREENVLFYLPRRCEATAELPAVCVNVRLEPHRLTSQYVKMELDTFNANITALFYKKEMPDVPQHMTISLIEQVKLRERISGKEVVMSITIAVLSILCIVLFILYWKSTRGSRNLKRKQLSKKSRPLEVISPTQTEKLL